VDPGALRDKLAGVFVPISTPFRDDEDVDYDALRFNLERYAASGVLGYLALGSNGENRSLTEEEKLRVLDTIVRHKGAWRATPADLWSATLVSIEGPISGCPDARPTCVVVAMRLQ